jgi:hypothetical protein
MTYSVSMEDVKAYVATVPEGEEVGVPNNMDYCLVASTLRWKYPDVSSHVKEYNLGATVAGQLVLFSDELFNTAEKFDSLWDSSDCCGVVTTTILKERMPELFGSKDLEREATNVRD